MLKTCGDSIYKPLEIIFRKALLTCVFPSEWKKGNIVPVRNETKQTTQDRTENNEITILESSDTLQSWYLTEG